MPVPVSVLVPEPVSVFVSPASARSAASFATPRSSDSPVAESLRLAQLTNRAASAIADAYRTLVFISLPRWLGGSAQTRADPSTCCSTRTAHGLPTRGSSTLSHVPSSSPQRTREAPRRRGHLTVRQLRSGSISISLRHGNVRSVLSACHDGGPGWKHTLQRGCKTRIDPKLDRPEQWLDTCELRRRSC